MTGVQTCALPISLGVLGSPAAGSAPGVAVYSRSPDGVPPGLPWRRFPDDDRAAAHDLFAGLRALDATGVPLIWVETPPDTPAWEGVRDRLRRAAA